jgi:hypothetical protein
LRPEKATIDWRDNCQLFCLDERLRDSKNETASTSSGNIRVLTVRQRHLHRLTRVISWGFAFLAAIASAQDAPHWKTSTAFTQQLKGPVDVQWQDRPLRAGLARLTQTYGVAMFLDRRVNPDQPITVSVHGQSLEELLHAIAHAAEAEISLLGPVVYFGPAEAVKELATLAALRRQDVAKFNAPAKARLLKMAPWQWAELSQPRDLLSELEQLAAVNIQNADLIPLDLWPATNLPPLPWTDRLTLLLFGFGYTCEFNADGTTAQLVPIPSSLLLEKKYTPRGGATELAAQLKRVLPGAKIRIEQSQMIVAARQEDHEKIERLLTGQSISVPKPAKASVEKLYSLTVPNQPAGNVVQTVAKSLGKQARFSSAVAEKLRQPIDLEVKDATLSHLLEATLKPLGLTFRLSEDILEVIEIP